MDKRILLIEDEQKLSFMIRETFALYDFSVTVASDGAEGLQAFARQQYDLVILDIMMPRLDGLGVLSQIRLENPGIPIIMLTAKAQTADLVKAFELGCNDYIRKPFVMDELLARVRALSGRTLEVKRKGPDSPIPIGSFIFLASAQELRSPSRVHNLSYKETEILKRLCQFIFTVVDRRNLLLELWGDDHLFNSRNLNVYITRLRNYLKEDSTIQIINIRSIGYKLIVKTISL